MTNRYTILGPLGRGGVGEVLLAEDAQLKRKVAIKRLHTEKGDEAAESLQQEATTLSSLNHPNVVTVHDVGIDEEGAYVVMEYLEGETFEELVERGALTWEDFQSVAVQSLEGLIAAQHLGLVHRDIKPGNLMLSWRATGSFDIKLLDFGLAKFSPKPSKQTVNQGDAIMGSIFFMAPEQFERGHLDWRTDLYSLGAVFYYGLTGHYPFEGNTAPEVMAAHLEHQVARLEELRPDVPVWACRWVHWLISRYQDDRPKDAVEALQVFVRTGEGMPASALEGSGVRLVTTATGSVIEQPLDQESAATQTATQGQTVSTTLPQQATSSKWILWASLGLAAVLGISLILFFSFRSDGDKERIRTLVEQGTLVENKTLEADENDYELLYPYLQGGYDQSAPQGSSKTMGYGATQAIIKFTWGGTDKRVLSDLEEEGNSEALLNLMRIAKERDVPAWINQLLPRFSKLPPRVQKNFVILLSLEIREDGLQLSDTHFRALAESLAQSEDVTFAQNLFQCLKLDLQSSQTTREKSRIVRTLLENQGKGLISSQRTNLLKLLAAGGVKQDLNSFQSMLSSSNEREVSIAIEALAEARDGTAAKLLTEHALDIYDKLEPSPEQAKRREQTRFNNRLRSAMKQVEKADSALAKKCMELTLSRIQEWQFLNFPIAALLARQEPWAGTMLDEITAEFPQHAEQINRAREGAQKRR